MDEKEVISEGWQRYEANKERYRAMDNAVLEIQNVIKKSGISTEDALSVLDGATKLFGFLLAMEKLTKDKQK